MSSLNKVQLIGNLGNDPDIRNTQDGRKISSFSLATSESWRDKNTGERRSKSDWHKIVCFNDGLSKVIEQYLKKGSKVYVEGKLVTRKWQDNNGNDRYTTEVVLQSYAGQLIMLDNKNNSNGNSGNNSQNNQSSSVNDSYMNDDIPF